MIRNSVAVGVQGESGADRSGFLWPENSVGSWTFENNVAHNNAGHGIFVWQNNSIRHVIDGFTAYYNEKSGIKHGAYENSYVYRNLTLLGNGTAITSLAQGEPGDGTDTQSWGNIHTNGGTLVIGEHVLEGESPVRFADCDFERVIVADDDGPERSQYDFIRCGLEPSDFDLRFARSDSVFRVQRANGTAYRLTGDGRVTSISAFAPLDPPDYGQPGGDRAGSGTFVDDNGSIFEDDIEWLAARVSPGCNLRETTVLSRRPRDPRQMAAFLVRACGTRFRTGRLLVDDDGSIFEGDIDRLRATSPVAATPTEQPLLPDDYVTRGQMAAFLVRAFGFTNPQRIDYFVDDNHSIFQSDINRLRVAESPAVNPPEQRYVLTTRHCGQMAAFLGGR